MAVNALDALDGAWLEGIDDGRGVCGATFAHRLRTDQRLV